MATNVYRRDGSPFWQYHYIHPITKERVRKTTKYTDHRKALEMFRKEYAEALDRKNLGTDSTMTVSQLIDWCWDNYWCFKPQANKKVRYVAMTAMLKKFGSVKAADLTPDMLREFMRERLVDCKISTVKRDFVYFSTAYAQAIKNKLLSDNPFRLIDASILNEDHLRRHRVATGKEIEALLGNSSVMLNWIIRFVLNSGLRKGEIENLKWSDIDFKRNRIATQTRKGGRLLKRNIPLFKGARKVLDEMERAGEYVFTNHLGQKIPADGMIHAGFPRLVARCAIEDLTFHDLRHTFATDYYRREKNLRAIQMILGHKNPNTTQRYLNLTDADLVPSGDFDFVCHKNDTLDDEENEKTSKSVENESSAVSSVG